MNRIALVSCSLFLFLPFGSKSQSVGIGTPTPHSSAQLDVSSTTKGTLITTMTTSQRKLISAPATGLLVFDIDKKTIYMYDGTRWLPLLFSNTEKNPPAYFTPSVISVDANFGYRVDIYGDYAIIGARQGTVVGQNLNTGVAYIYHRTNGVWEGQDIITADDGETDDLFGASVSINESFAIVGAWGDDVGANGSQGSVYIFSRDGEVWSQQSKITATDGAANDFFGFSVDISTSNTLVIGAYGDNINANIDQGSAYVYQGSAGIGGFIWALDAKLTASDGATGDSFGNSVGIYLNNIVVGAYSDDIGVDTDQGSAYVYYRFTNPGGWTTGQAHFLKLLSQDGEAFDYFGISVDIQQQLIAVGASGDDVDGNAEQGSAHIFVEAMGGGVPDFGPGQRMIAPDGAPSDNFGISVTLGAAGSLAVGAYRADDGGGIPNKGAVYVFKRPPFFDLVPSVFYRKVEDETGQANGYFGYSVSLAGYDLIIGAYGKNSTNGQIAFLNIE
jgi:hypothetical protein